MKKLWFKAKKYGYGWYPATWQGWFVILGYIVLISVFAFTLIKDSNFLVKYYILVALATFILIYVCYRTGEKPGWRWVDKK
jgi:hypothetical protein